MLRVFFIICTVNLTLCTYGQDETQKDSFQISRLSLSISSDPFFWSYEYLRPNIGIELRLAKEWSLYGDYGHVLSPSWLKNHVEASGIHCNTQLRYYHPVSFPTFFALNYGYQELTRSYYGTFPNASGYYLKQAKLNQYNHYVTASFGGKSYLTNHFAIEIFVGYGIGFRTNHFSELTAFEKMLTVSNQIPEFKRIGGNGRSTDGAVHWSIRMVHTLVH